jgi:hypothetical protein
MLLIGAEEVEEEEVRLSATHIVMETTNKVQKN